MSDEYAASRKAKVVGAIQWAAVGFSASNALWQAVSDYYLFVRDGFSIGLPSPFGTLLYGLLVASLFGGLVGGYVWVGRRTDSAERERREHRRRVAFLFVLLSLGVAALVAEMGVSELLGDRFYTVPYFLVAPALDLLALVGAYGLVYRTDLDWTDAGGESASGRRADGSYRPSLVAGAVGGVQWAVTALYLGVVVFGVVSEYLVRTRTSVNFGLGFPFVAAVALAFVAGYVRARRPAESSDEARAVHRRRVEYVLSVFAFGFVLSMLSGLAVTAVPALALGLNVLLFSGAVGLALLLAYLSVYVAEFDLLGRLLST